MVDPLIATIGFQYLTLKIVQVYGEHSKAPELIPSNCTPETYLTNLGGGEHNFKHQWLVLWNSYMCVQGKRLLQDQNVQWWGAVAKIWLSSYWSPSPLTMENVESNHREMIAYNKRKLQRR